MAKAVERPDFVKVGYLPCTIEFVENEEWKKRPIFAEHGGDGGLFIGAHGTIYLRYDEESHEQNLRETLLHEILHAVWFVTELSQENAKEWEDPEERVVGRSSGLLLDVLQSNPKVFKYLTSP
jgi:hypothetical protein